MAERGVEDEQRDVEEPGLHLVPFEDRPADVVAADEHVGPGEAADRTAVDRCAGDIRAGIGAQVARIPHRLGLFAEIDPHLGRPDHRPVVLRIDGDDVHRDQGLHRTAARDPGDLFPRLLRGLRVDIVGRHDLLHPRDRLDLPLFLRLVFFRHRPLLRSIEKPVGAVQKLNARRAKIRQAYMKYASDEVKRSEAFQQPARSSRQMPRTAS